MPKLRVHNLSMSLDGYVAGPNQSLEHPIGVGGPRLHEWVFASRAGRQMFGLEGGTVSADDEFIRRGEQNIGATIMGRNMFGPVRGPWPDYSWTGWWEENPPFHHPVFVLTHHARPTLSMAGGTTFSFTDEPIDTVLRKAFDAAGGRDVRLGGGASTVQQYLRAGLIDELHIAVVPILLGSGERLFEHVDHAPPGFSVAELVSSPSIAHVRLERPPA